MACKIEFRNFGTNTRDAILAKHSAILEFEAGIWPVVSEHLLYFCEQEIQEITGRQSKQYLQFLHKSGICKCSFTLSDSLRYIAVDDYSVDPDLFNAMVKSLQRPVFDTYAKHFEADLIAIRNVELDNVVIKEFIRKSVFRHLESFLNPSQHGNAAVRESKCLFTEELVAGLFPELSTSLGWNYEQFLTDNNCKKGFCQEQWECNARFFDLEPDFQAFWLEYLSMIAGRGKSTTFENVVDELRFRWSKILE